MASSKRVRMSSWGIAISSDEMLRRSVFSGSFLRRYRLRMSAEICLTRFCITLWILFKSSLLNLSFFAVVFFLSSAGASSSVPLSSDDIIVLVRNCCALLLQCSRSVVSQLPSNGSCFRLPLSPNFCSNDLRTIDSRTSRCPAALLLFCVSHNCMSVSR